MSNPETLSITSRCPCGAELDTYGEGPWRAEDARKALAAWLESHADHVTAPPPDTHQGSPDALDRAAAVYGLVESAAKLTVDVPPDPDLDDVLDPLHARLLEALDLIAETFEGAAVPVPRSRDGQEDT